MLLRWVFLAFDPRVSELPTRDESGSRFLSLPWFASWIIFATRMRAQVMTLVPSAAVNFSSFCCLPLRAVSSHGVTQTLLSGFAVIVSVDVVVVVGHGPMLFSDRRTPSDSNMHCIPAVSDRRNRQETNTHKVQQTTTAVGGSRCAGSAGSALSPFWCLREASARNT